MFKGYVTTKDKKCTMPFKNRPATELLTLDQAQDWPEYAGILDEDTILIDVDDKIQSDKLLQIVDDNNIACRVYETTRGKHFYFKNVRDGQLIQETNKVHCTLACGITADIKIGTKNSYSILKYAGKERPIIYDVLEGEEISELPFFMIPVKTNYDFRHLEAGDGRNQTFFNYILQLQAADLDMEQCRECIRMINKYVLPDPLDPEELEVILRDEAFQKPYFYTRRGQFLFDVFAKYLIKTNHIVKINGRLHIYRDGIYVADETAIQAEMIKHISNLNRAKRTEVMSYLDLLVEKNYEVSAANLIAFKNGIYDIDTDQFMDFSPDYIITNKINYNYVPDARCDLTDRTLDKIACGDPSIRKLLEEVIGYTLFRRNELRKAFILIGDKANGKSTYLDMIETLLGPNNTVALDLKELGDRFKTAELFNKLANIGDDIGDDFIPNPAVFKKLVSGDRLNAERKGHDPFDFNSYAKLLFSANNIPRIKDKSGAVIDRLIIVPFNARFSADDPDYDPYIKYKLRSKESMEYLIQVGLDGLYRVLEDKHFTISEKVQKELEEYEEFNNPVLVFLKEDPKIENEPTQTVYRRYNEFCAINGFTPLAHVAFSRQINQLCNMKTVVKKVNGKCYKVFVKKE